MHEWNQIWPNLVSNVFWLVPVFLARRFVRAVRALSDWVESIENMRVTIQENTEATKSVTEEFHSWRHEVMSKLLDLAGRVSNLESKG